MGSISGVDISRFHPEPLARLRVRASLGIPSEATVFGYIGRLRKQKGVLDLAAAFARLCRTSGDAYLIVVGPDEENLRPKVRSLCMSCCDKLRFVDYTPAPEEYMVSADVLCLPSYREGFGSVIIEAAACGVPSLASRIYGVTDAVVERLTGVLHEPGNVDDLADGMRRLIDNPAWRSALGSGAHARAEAYFTAEKVTAAVLEYYRTAFGRLTVNRCAANEWTRA
jgi:glycosyltransferase involved in cell wall biosynthesis